MNSLLSGSQSFPPPRPPSWLYCRPRRRSEWPVSERENNQTREISCESGAPNPSLIEQLQDKTKLQNDFSGRHKVANVDILVTRSVTRAWTVVDLRGARGTCGPLLGSKFFQFHAVLGKIWQNCMLVSFLGSWYPSLGKSWIRHWWMFQPEIKNFFP